MSAESKYGSLKILWHPNKLKSLLEGEVVAPIYVRVKPTNRCNHRCYYCIFDPKLRDVISRRFKRGDEIPKEKIEQILDDFQEMGVKAVTYSGGGDPLVYSFISETLRKTLENNLDLSVITNGQQLNGERADLLTKAKWVRISLDSPNPETFVKIRRVPERFFYELVDNISQFAQKKDPKCEFGINFVVNNENSSQVYDAVKFFRELGVNHIKITPVSVEEFFEYHRPVKDVVLEQIFQARKDFTRKGFEVYDTYENDFNMTGVCERTYSQCYMMQILPVIGADSVVYTCHDKPYTESGVIGSIKDRSFKDLWFSPETAEKFRTFDPREQCQHYCTNDAKNRLIDKLMECYGDHINFV